MGLVSDVRGNIRSTSYNGDPLPYGTNIVPYTTEYGNDNLGEWNNEAHRFTAQQEGYYQINAGVRLYSENWPCYGSSYYTKLSLYKNGAAYSVLDHQMIHAPGGSINCPDRDENYNIYLQGSDIVHMEAGNYIDLKVYHNTYEAYPVFELMNNAWKNHYISIHKLS